MKKAIQLIFSKKLLQTWEHKTWGLWKSLLTSYAKKGKNGGMCQWRFIKGNKRTTLSGDIDNKKINACVDAGSLWEVSASSVKYCYEYKTTLKNKVYFLKCLMGDL